MPTDPKDIQALRDEAEKALSEASEKPAPMAGADLQKVLHELSVHEIELEMQNEELRRSQEQLEESRSEYADLYDSAPVGYLTFDEKALITRANLTACGLLGIERSFLVKKPFTFFIHPDYQDLFYAHKQNALKSTATETCQLVLKRKDGTFFDAQLESAPVQFNGQPALNSILTDITERRQFEKERETASLELERKVKERTAELLRAEDELRKHRDELESLVYERTEQLRKAYEKLKEEVAEREHAEAQLRQAQKMDALGTLSGGIAHDFNNILAAIIGFTELAADHVPKESREAHHLKRVMESSLRGRELVRQMLTFSRKAEQEKKPLGLSGIVRETVKLIRATTPTTIGIRVNALSESGLILADPAQMQQVIMNLCTNAVYSMREKGGTLDIRLSDHGVSTSDGDTHGIRPGPYTRLIVRDTGAGIAPDIIDKVFDPFFTTKKVGEGTGLGLSVVHGIVKQHYGYIAVESEPGRGSAFTVYFPQISGGSETEAVGGDELPTGAERILFVDDEEALAEMGEDILAELGYEATSRMSGREALALFRADPSRFDLVMTDQTMPQMTGIDLAKEILTLRPGMPIIMCTGFSELVDADKAMAAGIKAFAMKPLTKREIAGTIRKVLDE